MRRGALVLGAMLVVACGTTGASTPPGPAQTTASSTASPSDSVDAPETFAPSPLPSATVFTSPIYGYTVTVPAGWTVIPARDTWDGTSSVGSDEPIVDQLIGPSVENRCAKVFKCGPNAWGYAAPDALALADFAAQRVARDAADHPCPTTPETNETMTIGGVPAVLQSKHCPAGDDGQYVVSAFAVKGGVGFELYLEDRSHDPSAEAADRADFLGLLGTVVLPG